jgi:hypothetical protein
MDLIVGRHSDDRPGGGEIGPLVRHIHIIVFKGVGSADLTPRAGRCVGVGVGAVSFEGFKPGGEGAKGGREPSVDGVGERSKLVLDRSAEGGNRGVIHGAGLVFSGSVEGGLDRGESLVVGSRERRTLGRGVQRGRFEQLHDLCYRGGWEGEERRSRRGRA